MDERAHPKRRVGSCEIPWEQQGGVLAVSRHRRGWRYAHLRMPASKAGLRGPLQGSSDRQRRHSRSCQGQAQAKSGGRRKQRRDSNRQRTYTTLIVWAILVTVSSNSLSSRSSTPTFAVRMAINGSRRNRSALRGDSSIHVRSRDSQSSSACISGSIFFTVASSPGICTWNPSRNT